MTSLAEIEEEEMFRVYPNPASGMLFVDILDGSEQEYAVIDMLGRERISGQISNKQQIDISALSPGQYLLRIVDLSSGKYSAKVFLKK